MESENTPTSAAVAVTAAEDAAATETLVSDTSPEVENRGGAEVAGAATADEDRTTLTDPSSSVPEAETLPAIAAENLAQNANAEATANAADASAALVPESVNDEGGAAVISEKSVEAETDTGAESGDISFVTENDAGVPVHLGEAAEVAEDTPVAESSGAAPGEEAPLSSAEVAGDQS